MYRLAATFAALPKTWQALAVIGGAAALGVTGAVATAPYRPLPREVDSIRVQLNQHDKDHLLFANELKELRMKEDEAICVNVLQSQHMNALACLSGGAAARVDSVRGRLR